MDPTQTASGDRMPGKSGKSSRRKTGSKSHARDDSGMSDGTTDAASDQAARLALRQSEKRYYRIGEVSRITGVKAHVLRYWETEFRWMAPPKSRSKQRLYRKRDIEFVWLLKRLLWDERYTIAGARQRIQDLGVDEALALLDPSSGTPATDAASPNASSHSIALPSAGLSASDEREANGSARTPSRASWVSFRSALDEMQNELLALRGVLQDGV